MSNSKRPRKAVIWDYFDMTSEGLSKCKLCDQEITRKSGQTSTMRRHLSSNHKSEFEELLKTESAQLPKKRTGDGKVVLQPTLESSFKTVIPASKQVRNRFI
jgi:hypothetical protein